MSWIKRNLYFVILSAVALVLMGLAGFFAYTKWDAHNKIVGDLNADYGVLQDLNKKNPHPGSGAIDNDAKAKEQKQQLKDFTKQALTHFQVIRPVPDIPDKLTD